MRFLKSLVLVLFCIWMRAATAQDTTTLPTDSTVVFHADKVSGLVLVQEHILPDSAVARLRSDEAFWYANMDFRKKAAYKKPQASLFGWLLRQHWFYTLLWFVIISSFIAVLILFLMKSNIQLFHKAPLPLALADDIIPPQTIFDLDYNDALNKAIATSDFNLAVRLYYLQTLVLLSKKNCIAYKEEYTNSDYLHQLHHSEHYVAFKKLTRHFEYAWYGKFPVAPTAFKTIETDFITFKSNMGI